MHVTLAHIGSRGSSRDAMDDLTRTYLTRCTPYASCEAQAFRDEAGLWEWLGRKQGRTQAVAVLLDSRGTAMSSEAFAAWIGKRRDEGTQHIVLAVGPADGWSPESRKQAALLLSLGPMTLAHGLARVVIAEQLYRAFTILAGHPYHTGHK